MQPNQPTLADLRAALDALGPGPWRASNMEVDGDVGLVVNAAGAPVADSAGDSARIATVLNFAAAVLPAIEALGEAVAKLGPLDTPRNVCVDGVPVVCGALLPREVIALADVARRVVKAGEGKV